MFVSVHVLISLLIGLTLYPFFGVYAIIFFLAGFLIDIDHNIEYAISHKDLRPFGAYRYFMKKFQINIKRLKEGKKMKQDKMRLHVFHTFELLFLLLVIGFFNRIILFIFWGFFSHVLTDIAGSFYLRYKFKGKIEGNGRYHLITSFFLNEYLHKK